MKLMNVAVTACIGILISAGITAGASPSEGASSNPGGATYSAAPDIRLASQANLISASGTTDSPVASTMAFYPWTTHTTYSGCQTAGRNRLASNPTRFRGFKCVLITTGADKGKYKLWMDETAPCTDSTVNRELSSDRSR